MSNRRKFLLSLAISYLAVFVWSLISPRNYFIWCLEVAPVLIGLALLFAMRNRFIPSTLFWLAVWMHAIILTIGAHYTYAQVPLFNWIRDTFHTARNSYDAIGHFAQGFMPAIFAREILLRATPLKRDVWLSGIVVCVCLAISASYELIEWLVAISTGSAADAFLGTQGDVWDTQKDMALALVGSIISLAFLSRLHDRSMSKVPDHF